MKRFELPIFDQSFKSDPHGFYAGLRDSGHSVAPVRLPGGMEAWLVTSHSAARLLLADPRLSKNSANAAPPKGAPRAPARVRAPHSIFRHLLMLDPPDHTRLHSLVAKKLSWSQIQCLRPRIEEVATILLDKMAPKGHADIIEDFALPLSIKTICEFVGVPSSDEHLVRSWSADLLRADLEDPDLVPQIAQDLEDYLEALAQRKRTEPDGSLFCALVQDHENQKLSSCELSAMGFVLLFAGHETMTNLIGNGVYMLLRDRAQWSMLCASTDLVCSAVEELLRFECPLEVATPRYATAEIQVENVCMRPGDTVFVGLAAANRDSQRFERADNLDIRRADATRHLSFGFGIHYCVGAALARLEGEIAFTALIRRFPDLEPTSEFETLIWIPGLITRGLRTLPVRFFPRT